jgi:hypothetical protein
LSFSREITPEWGLYCLLNMSSLMGHGTIREKVLKGTPYTKFGYREKIKN